MAWVTPLARLEVHATTGSAYYITRILVIYTILSILLQHVRGSMATMCMLIAKADGTSGLAIGHRRT